MVGTEIQIDGAYFIVVESRAIDRSGTLAITVDRPPITAH
jgi:hypothetical protein